MQVDYARWAKEYEGEAQRIKDHIGSLKVQLQAADERQTRQLHSRIYLLYGMYLECRNTAQILRQYDKKNRTTEGDAIGC